MKESTGSCGGLCGLCVCARDGRDPFGPIGLGLDRLGVVSVCLSLDVGASPTVDITWLRHFLAAKLGLSVRAVVLTEVSGGAPRGQRTASRQRNI
jgi:hypothetical protein